MFVDKTRNFIFFKNIKYAIMMYYSLVNNSVDCVSSSSTFCLLLITTPPPSIMAEVGGRTVVRDKNSHLFI